MSRPIFSTAAAVGVASALAQPRQAHKRRFWELGPGLRLIEGRVLYSAAWLDHSTSHPRPSDAEARSARRPKGGLGD